MHLWALLIFIPLPCLPVPRYLSVILVTWPLLSLAVRVGGTGEPRFTMVRYTMIHLYDGYVLLPFVSILRCCRAFTMVEIPSRQPLGGQFPVKIHFPHPPCHLLSGRELFSHLCLYYSISMSIINADRLCIICESRSMCNSADGRGKYRPVCRRGWERLGSEQLSHTFTQHIELALVHK